MKKTALLLLFCAVLLQGCAGTSPPGVRTELVKIPDALLICPDEPVVTEVKTQRDVANYIEDLRFFGRSCKAQIDAIRHFQDTVESK